MEAEDSRSLPMLPNCRNRSTRGVVLALADSSRGHRQRSLRDAARILQRRWRMRRRLPPTTLLLQLMHPRGAHQRLRHQAEDEEASSRSPWHAATLERRLMMRQECSRALLLSPCRCFAAPLRYPEQEQLLERRPWAARSSCPALLQEERRQPKAAVGPLNHLLQKQMPQPRGCQPTHFCQIVETTSTTPVTLLRRSGGRPPLASWMIRPRRRSEQADELLTLPLLPRWTTAGGD